MKTVCIVQARMGSTRLPGKVLLPLNGHTVIGEVLSRCKKIVGVDEVVCAIPTTPGDDVLAEEAKKYTAVIRGPEHDVLARYWMAAKSTNADIIMRVTADCPCLSPEICGDILETRAMHGVDYASNCHPRTFQRGMDCEVFTFDLLRRAHENAGSNEREHVTTWMLMADARRANVVASSLTLDTEADYQQILAAFTNDPKKRLRAA
jgi:spore coat polysaccharide biosynthesis protein SpsF